MPTIGSSATLADGRGNHERVVPYAIDQLIHRIAERTGQQHRRRDDQAEAEKDDQGGGKPLPAANPVRQHLVQRIEGDRQDQCPQHHRQERRKEVVAQQHERKHEAGTDENIEQAARQALLQFVIGLIGCIQWDTSRLGAFYHTLLGSKGVGPRKEKPSEGES